MGLIVLAVLLGMGSAAYAELQEVRVGGEIIIRGRTWVNSFDGGAFNPFPPSRVTGRPIGPFGIVSNYDWDDNGKNRTYIEQHARLWVDADFTDDVSARIGVQDFAVWGEDFRSENYLTGLDSRGSTGDDVEVYQAYIEARNMFGKPLRLRVGRQEIVMGKGWLIGNKISPLVLRAFDGLRLTYDTDSFSIDAFATKMAEGLSDFGDNDVDLYGIYATCKAIEAGDLALFWYMIRDDRPVDDSPGSTRLVDLIEDWVDVNDYDTVNLHTVGARFNGSSGAFDYDAKVAYQFGDVDAAGQGFTIIGAYGDDDVEYDNWAFDVEAGYTFDSKWSPRVYLGGAWYEGQDNRDVSFLEWVNPFRRPEASVSFNRMFSHYFYTASTDILTGASAMSNFWQVRTGVSVKPTESVSTGLKLAYFWVDETFDLPKSFGPIMVPGPFVFATEEADDDLGLMATLWLKYNYSEDWWISVAWEHLFVGDGYTDGNFIFKNGFEFSRGTDDKDVDYIHIITGVKF